MKIGLYQIDGQLPNLALMKLSAYHKLWGNTIEWANPLGSYDKVYASQIFTDSKADFIPNMKTGGTGVSLDVVLPKEVDDTKPDYGIYPDCDYSVGFTTRGCIRNCEFCFVPKKEGKIHEYRSVADIWRGKGDLILLDNNILAMPHKFVEVLEFCEKHKIKVDFNQGLDCRLVTDDTIKVLIKYKKYIFPEVRFAFDSLAYRNAVERVCKKLPFRCRWYVYCDENWESAFERLLILKRYRQSCYVMRNKRVAGKNHQKWSKLHGWGSWDAKFYSMDFYEFIHLREGLKEIKDEKRGQQVLFP